MRNKMKITKRQLRKIIKEEISRLDDLYVVIGNAGRGRQNLWPKSDEPEVLTKAEAEKIAQDLNSRQGGGYMQISYHVKPLGSAAEYISPGQAAHAGIISLIDKHGI
tara:strand:+ start:4670 stop:4990 length:321 start_codon:yes stop_codon:yes gene_type:complete